MKRNLRKRAVQLCARQFRAALNELRVNYRHKEHCPHTRRAERVRPKAEFARLAVNKCVQRSSKRRALVCHRVCTPLSAKTGTQNELDTCFVGGLLSATAPSLLRDHTTNLLFKVWIFRPLLLLSRLNYLREARSLMVRHTISTPFWS